MQWNLPSGEARLLPPKARAFTEPLLCVRHGATLGLLYPSHHHPRSPLVDEEGDAEMRSLVEGHRANQCRVKIQTRAWLPPEPSSLQAPTLPSVAPDPLNVRAKGLSPQGFHSHPLLVSLRRLKRGEK